MQICIRAWLAREGSCPQEAWQVESLERPMTGPEKSHTGHGLELESTRVPRQCLLSRCSWQKAWLLQRETHTLLRNEILNLKCFFPGRRCDHQSPLGSGFIQGGVGCPCEETQASRKAPVEACVSPPFTSAPPSEGPKCQCSRLHAPCLGYRGLLNPKRCLRYGRQK